MNELRKICELAKGKPWRYRLKLLNREEAEDWSEWIIIPTEGYIELKSLGPVRISDIDWVEINPSEIRRIGKLIPDSIIDHFDEATSLLLNLKIDFSVKERILRIKNLD